MDKLHPKFDLTQPGEEWHGFFSVLQYLKIKMKIECWGCAKVKRRAIESCTKWRSRLDLAKIDVSQF